MTAAGTVIDASTLINFLRVDGAHLLGTHPSAFLVTSRVDREVIHAEQRRRLLGAVKAGHLALRRGGQEENTPLYLLARKAPLGAGESSAIVVALENKWSLATDDKGAARFVKQQGLALPIITTWGIFRELVVAGVLTERGAGSVCRVWDEMTSVTCGRAVLLRPLAPLPTRATHVCGVWRQDTWVAGQRGALFLDVSPVGPSPGSVTDVPDARHENRVCRDDPYQELRDICLRVSARVATCCWVLWWRPLR